MAFNRIRSKVTKTQIGVLNSLGYTGKDPCAYLGVNRTGSAKYDDTMQVRDEVPVGTYRPGEFKITDVEMSSNKYVMSPIHGPCHSSAGSCPDSVFDGKWAFGHTFSPSASLISPVVPETKVINELALSASAKMRSADVDLGETFAEFGSVLAMMRNPLEGMRKVLTACLFRRGGGLRSARDASSAWLEYRYGWNPLVKDLTALYEGLPYWTKTGIYSSDSFRVDSQMVPSPSVLIAPFGSRYAPRLRAHGESSNKRIDRFRYYFSVTEPGTMSALKRGHSVFNAPSLAWQLVPLSFVVDWWWGVGEWIQATTPTPFIRILGATYSIRITSSRLSVLTGSLYADKPQYERSTMATFEERKEYYLRLKTWPTINFSAPTLDIDIRSIKHAIDSLSLIIQRVPRRII